MMHHAIPLTLAILLIAAGGSGALSTDSGTDDLAPQVRSVTPHASYEEGFRWDYSSWHRDVDRDGVDDLIEDVARDGLDALPRMPDGFLPFAAVGGSGGPLLDLHIAYKEGVGEGDLAALETLGLGSLQVDAMLPSVWAFGATPEQAMRAAQLPGVVMVEIEQVLRALNNVARQATQVEESSTYADGVWDDLGYTGDGIGIAILDTGVDDEHDFLQGRFVAGADTIVGGCTIAADINPDDDNAVSVGLIGFGLLTHHGSHVAGTALGHGSTNPSSLGDHAGMAKEADLYDVKVLTAPGISCGNSVRNGLTWIDSFNQGFTNWHNPLHPGHVTGSPEIHIASLSLGGSCSDGSDALSQSVNWLVNKGVVTVVAVGNDAFQTNTAQAGCITSPSAAAEAISVGAYDDDNSPDRTDDRVAGFSNCGPTHYPSPTSDQKKPDVTAPGLSIVSVRGSPVGQGGGSGGLAALSGTSMATPVVSGIVALMLEKDPTLTPAQVKTHLRDNAEYRTDGIGFTIGSDWHSCWGFGQVNAYETVLAV